MGFGVSNLGSECQSCTSSHRWPCVYAEGQGRKTALANSFVPGGEYMLSDEQITFPLCAPDALQILFLCCVSMDFLPAFFPRAVQCPWGSITPKPDDLYNSRLYAILVVRRHEIGAFSPSKPIAMGFHFPIHSPLC